MPTVNDVATLLDEFAPPALAEEWDNVGLLVGDRNWPVQRLMTGLTLTPATVDEAIQRQADLVVVHHPLPFRPLSQVTTDTTVGGLLWELIGARVAVYSPHTAFDSSGQGVNQMLADGLGLKQIEPLAPADAATQGPDVGRGRCGTPDRPQTLVDMAQRAKAFLSLSSVRVVGDDAQPARRVAIACGSGGSLLEAARQRGCDCLVTGESSFHTCLEAEATGVGLILTGHYASERFAVERLADYLNEKLAGVEVWSSGRERDPLRVV